MVLAIDIGNSLTKLAVFENDTITGLQTAQELSVVLVSELLEKHPGIQRTVISAVKEIDASVLQLLAGKTRLLQLTNQTRLPFTNRYETPETLGKDRIAAVAGAASLYPKENVLVIDAGTCITYDLLTAGNEYLGGGISPGIDMRFRALNTFTGKLPLIEADKSQRFELTGTSTEGSIRSGVQAAVLLEGDATIDAYKKQFHPLRVVVTGGDGFYFDKYLKNNIFAAPNLVLIGLKKILDFNEGS